MQSTTTTPEGGKILIDPRIYDISRRLSIRGSVDALIELITNSYDAFSSKGTFGTVKITTIPASRKIIVCDNASGISAVDFNEKILTVGKFTAEYSSRGLMGRGLKDITAIGALTVRTVKDGRYSRCDISTDLTISNLMLDVTPPAHLWDVVCIQEVGSSFFHVEVALKKDVEFLSEETLFRRLRDNIAIRRDTRNTLLLNGKVVKFVVPGEDTKKLISSFKFKVPGYEDSLATLAIFKHSTNLSAKCREQHPSMGGERKDYFYNGIEIVSGATSFEVSDCNDGTWSSSGYSSYNFIRGVLDVPYVHFLARDLFATGATETNPFLIFDSNRRDGLNKRHPFVKALFTEAGKWVRHVLRTVSKSDDAAVNEGDFLRSVLDTLSKSIFDSIAMTDSKVYTWESKKTTEDLKEFQENIEYIDHIDDSLKFENDNIIPNEPQQPPVMERTETLVRPSVKFEIVTEKDMDYIYRVKYEGENITVYMNSLDPALKTYVEFVNTATGDVVDPTLYIDAVDQDIPPLVATLEPSEPAYVMMGMIVREAITEIHTRNLLLSGNMSTTTDDMNSVNDVKKEAYDTFKPQVSSLFSKIYVPKNVAV